jgi:hypothetical protein
MRPSSSVPVLQGLVVVGLLLCCVMMVLYSQYRHPCRRKRGLYKTHKEKVSHPDQCVYDSIQVYLEAKHEIERDYKCRKSDPRYYDYTYLSSLHSYVPHADSPVTKVPPRTSEKVFQVPPTTQRTFDTADRYVSNLVEDIRNKELQSDCYSELLAKHPTSARSLTHKKAYDQLGICNGTGACWPLENNGDCPKKESVKVHSWTN